MPLSLAQLPTPLERLERVSEALGADVWVKRDDLTGLGLSGNKVRKLRHLLADALAVGADTVITTGGLQSNHARATAVAARRLGLEPILLLRGTMPDVPDGNLLLDRLLGAQIHTCTPEVYRTQRDARMQALARRAADRGRTAYIIPEGGSNWIGSRGFRDAAAEVAAQQPQPFDHVVVAVGSGGTLAGLALGPDIGPLEGVAVCDDRDHFAAVVHRIAAEAGVVAPRQGSRWRVVEGYQGEGYGVASPEVWETLTWIARLEGLILDPTYTGKAMHALVSQVRSGAWGGRILFWHTGGAFGLFGRGPELPRP